MREIRKKQRQKRQMLALTIIIVVLIVFAYQLFKPTTIDAHEPLQVVTVIVEKGDSLWKIADRYDNNKMDLRQYIYIIESYNKLDNTVLQPGQRIRVPLY